MIKGEYTFVSLLMLKYCAVLGGKYQVARFSLSSIDG